MEKGGAGREKFTWKGPEAREKKAGGETGSPLMRAGEWEEVGMENWTGF